MAEPVFVLVAVVAKALPWLLGDWSQHRQLHVLQEIVLGLVWPPEPALALLPVVVHAVQVTSQLIVPLRLQLLVQLVQGYMPAEDVMVQPSVALDLLVIEIVEKDRPWTCLLFAVMVKGNHLSFSSPWKTCTLPSFYLSVIFSLRWMSRSFDVSSIWSHDVTWIDDVLNALSFEIEIPLSM